MNVAVPGTLIVIFIKGRNLPNKRTLGKQNPYCIGRVGHHAKRCPADFRGGQTPKWDHEVRYDVLEIADHRTLKLSVLDENDSKPELIGDTTIRLQPVFDSLPSEGYDAWHELEYKGKYAGEVYLEMTFYPTKPIIPPKKARKKKKSSIALPPMPGGQPQPAAQSLPLHPFPPPQAASIPPMGQPRHALSASDSMMLNSIFTASQRPLPSQPGNPDGEQQQYLPHSPSGYESMPELPEEFANMSISQPPVQLPLRHSHSQNLSQIPQPPMHHSVLTDVPPMPDVPLDDYNVPPPRPLPGDPLLEYHHHQLPQQPHALPRQPQPPPSQSIHKPQPPPLHTLLPKIPPVGSLPGQGPTHQPQPQRPTTVAQNHYPEAPRPHSIAKTPSPQPPRSNSQSPGSSPGSSGGKIKTQRKPVGSGPSMRKPVVISGVTQNPHLFEDEVSEMPFSPDDYGKMSPTKPLRTPGASVMIGSQQTVLVPPPPPQKNMLSDDILDVSTYAPEPVLKKKDLPQIPGRVEPGISGYAGEGQWDLTRKINDGFGDSLFNRALNQQMLKGKPHLPPKIPLGMTREEYVAMNGLREEDEDPYQYRMYA
ncbi:hypothetical protein TRVA0_031S01552 [Trichomonascus vanleenenianus]|uniref:Inn1p n=1 Tax=Trichomonascus vanleenenianus TaxID=2268995 RepID=UPI003ECB116E